MCRPGHGEGMGMAGSILRRSDTGRPRSAARFWPWATALAAAAAFDWLLTWVQVEAGLASEGNPLAAAVLDRHGWWGLGLFKMALTLLVVLLALVVCRRRAAAARRILQASCGILAAVLAYHALLLGRAAAEPSPRQTIAQQQVLSATLDWQLQRLRNYDQKVDELADLIISGRRTLRQATEELNVFIAGLGYIPPCMHFRAFCPGLNPRACLAAHLVMGAGFLVRDDPERARSLLSRLRTEFAAYHPVVPRFALEGFPGESL